MIFNCAGDVAYIKAEEDSKVRSATKRAFLDICLQLIQYSRRECYRLDGVEKTGATILTPACGEASHRCARARYQMQSGSDECYLHLYSNGSDLFFTAGIQGSQSRHIISASRSDDFYSLSLTPLRYLTLL